MSEPQKKNTNLLADGFEFISETINGAERSFLDLLSALVPYAVPIIPAYLTYFHTLNQMNFPVWVAATAGIYLWGFSITSVSTAIRFYRHNQMYKDVKNQAPFWLAFGTYVFYIVVVLSVNVLLEVYTGVRSPAVIWSIGLFSLLSLPSAVLISIRAQYSENARGKTREAGRAKKPLKVLLWHALITRYRHAPAGGSVQRKGQFSEAIIRRKNDSVFVGVARLFTVEIRIKNLRIKPTKADIKKRRQRAPGGWHVEKLNTKTIDKKLCEYCKQNNNFLAAAHVGGIMFLVYLKAGILTANNGARECNRQ